MNTLLWILQIVLALVFAGAFAAAHDESFVKSQNSDPDSRIETGSVSTHAMSRLRTVATGNPPTPRRLYHTGWEREIGPRRVRVAATAGSNQPGDIHMDIALIDKMG